MDRDRALSPDSYVEARIPRETVCEARARGEAMQRQWGPVGRRSSDGAGATPGRTGDRGPSAPESGLSEKRPAASQKESTHTEDHGRPPPRTFQHPDLRGSQLVLQARRSVLFCYSSRSSLICTHWYHFKPVRCVLTRESHALLSHLSDTHTCIMCIINTHMCMCAHTPTEST